MFYLLQSPASSQVIPKRSLRAFKSMDEDSAGSPGHTPATIRFPSWEPLAAISLAFGDGWKPTRKNGDFWGWCMTLGLPHN